MSPKYFGLCRVTKYLGVILDQKCEWRRNVNEFVNKKEDTTLDVPGLKHNIERSDIVFLWLIERPFDHYVLLCVSLNI